MSLWRLLTQSCIIIFLLTNYISSKVIVKKSTEGDITYFNVQINGYQPTKNDDYNDDYVSVAVRAEPGYIVKFEPSASGDRVHHILLYGCAQPAYPSSFWQGTATCAGMAHILYAWARNAPDLELPKDVAIPIGNQDDPVQYLVMQIHYSHPFEGNVRDFSGIKLHLSPVRPKYIAQVFLFVSNEPIPPKLDAAYNNMSCYYRGNATLHPFAFRTHTHAMGRVVSAFLNHDNEWQMIGKRNPQWPQLFQKLEKPLEVKTGDFMAAMCRFDSHDKDKPVPMGAMGVDEMCNFYMMFYRSADVPDPFPYGAYCGANENPQAVATQYPLEGTTLLPSHPEWEHVAHQASKPFGVVEKLALKKLGDHEFGQISSIAFDPKGNLAIFHRVVEKLALKKLGDHEFGQISSIAFDPKGNLAIFHRGSRVWNANSFDRYNQLTDKSPIPEATLIIGKENGDKLEFVEAFGNDLFYMPHGLFIDEENNYYTTDVGTHQVIKWKYSNGQLAAALTLGERFVPGSDSQHFCKPAIIKWKYSNGQLAAALTLGERFVPGSDTQHFCKPAGVVVSKKDGSIFVADGYCNNRILHFSKSGEFIAEFGQASSSAGREISHLSLGYFQLPHDITLDEENERIYIADRENGRVQIYDFDHKPVSEIRNQQFFGNVYSVHYCSAHGLFFIPGLATEEVKEINVFVVPKGSTTFQYAFRPKSTEFSRPHIVRANTNSIYVGEIDDSGGVLWKFNYIQEESHMLMSDGSKSGDNEMYSVKNASSAQGTLVVTMIVIMAFAMGIMYFMRRHRVAINSRTPTTLLDRAGFKPLRTDDLDDDDSEDELSLPTQSTLK
uniref:Peptidylglycine monooxygenase n=1 Tax=Panagrolaimus sp. PS1159 TaxID=55785 RepID=A0AC35G258_9BILA